MYISIDKLLNKMEEELQAAKHAETEAVVKGKLQVIKALCDLVLEEKSVKREVAVPVVKKEQRMPSTIAIDDDEANGDSLLDF